MAIDLLCPGCGKTLRLADEHAGKTGKCPACSTQFQIPQPNSPANAAANQPDTWNGLPTLAPLEPRTIPKESETQPWNSTERIEKPNPNPYAAPQSTSTFTPASNQATDTSATAATVLGIIAIVASTMGFCCCPITLLSLPVGITGLIIAYQAPPHLRQTPLILNVVGIGLSLFAFLILAVSMIGS